MCCDKTINLPKKLIWMSFVWLVVLDKFVTSDYEDSWNIYNEKPCCNRASNDGQYYHRTKHQTEGN